MPENNRLHRKEIISHLALLGQVFGHLAAGRPWPGFDCGLNEVEFNDMKSLIAEAEKHNGWFTEAQVKHAFEAWSETLSIDALEEWTSAYEFAGTAKRVGLIMAGNIPLVGLHDMISILLSGHVMIARPSSEDHILTRMVAAVLSKFDERYDSLILWADGKLKDYDAVIATGSNNTSRYFEYYFSKVPHIIRKNRTAIAIIDGEESEEELAGIGEDIFRYFGLGCRNVTKIYIPEDYDLDRFFGAIFPHQDVVKHNKYANNYDYHKSVFLLNDDDIIENGFLLLKPSEELFSPVASLHYERYADSQSLRKKLEAKADDIQCIVSRQDIPFGAAQKPGLSDYADGVDTMSFLSGL